MRTIQDAEVAWTKGAELPERLLDTYVQSADADDLELRFNQALVELAKKNLALTPEEAFEFALVDLAGGGDGHTFAARLFSASNQEEPEEITESFGIDPALARVFFYQGSQSEALAKARADIDAKIAALFELDDIDAVQLLQTGFAGASQGTRFCGFVLVFLVVVDPTIVDATLDGPGNLTINGTNFLSTLPNTKTSVLIAGPGVGTDLNLTQDEIVAGGGGVFDVSISIPAALLGTTAVGDTVEVFSNGGESGSSIIA
jgi:hypothetical protein